MPDEALLYGSETLLNLNTSIIKFDFFHYSSYIRLCDVNKTDFIRNSEVISVGRRKQKLIFPYTPDYIHQCRAISIDVDPRIVV